MATAFGEYFRECRLARGLSLREFCREHGFDAGNLSKLERGKLPPPESREKLETYARALGLDEGSDEWYEFFDRAAAAKGEIPADLLDDQAVLDKLPLLFRTLRGEPVPDEKLDELVELIRKG